MFIPYKKATILIPSGPPKDPERKHLFILLSDPLAYLIEEKEVNCNLIVPISSIKKNTFFDNTCVIEKDEHPFITRKSFVLYRYCRIEETEKILVGVKKGLFTPHKPINKDLFERIYQGLFASPFVPGKVFSFLERNKNRS